MPCASARSKRRARRTNHASGLGEAIVNGRDGGHAPDSGHSRDRDGTAGFDQTGRSPRSSVMTLAAPIAAIPYPDPARPVGAKRRPNPSAPMGDVVLLMQIAAPLRSPKARRSNREGEHGLGPPGAPGHYLYQQDFPGRP